MIVKSIHSILASLAMLTAVILMPSWHSEYNPVRTAHAIFLMIFACYFVLRQIESDHKRREGE
jgi:predicted benzoate:H+ symporter BenE